MIVDSRHNPFNDCTNGFWERKGRGTTVWSRSTLGEILIADCTNKSTPLTTQRANAKLIALSPDMYMVIEDIRKRGLDAFAKKNIDYIINRMSLPND